jgi:hypothetical protein
MECVLIERIANCQSSWAAHRYLNSFQFEYSRLLLAASADMFDSEIDSVLVLCEYLGRLLNGFVERQVQSAVRGLKFFVCIVELWYHFLHCSSVALCKVAIPLSSYNKYSLNQ